MITGLSLIVRMEGTGNEITASIRNGYYHVLGNSSASIIPFGNVAETIIYDTPSLSEEDNAKIESYLALKYGITLDQTTPQSYVNSEGTEIYDSDEAFDDFGSSYYRYWPRRWKFFGSANFKKYSSKFILNPC